MKAQQVFAAVMVTGLFVLLLLYALTSQMISAVVMVKAVEDRHLTKPSSIPGESLPVWSASAVVAPKPTGEFWFTDMNANNWTYRYNYGQTHDESQPWHSCDEPVIVPDAIEWTVTEFCKKYVFTPMSK